MKIEKGQKYLCVADIKTENILSGNSYFTKGKIYYSPTDFTLIANDGNGMSLDNNDGIFFQPLSSAKWAIKRTPENAEVVNRWAGSEFCVTPEVFVYHDKLVSFELIDGYTEIDFETFKEITGMGEEKKQDINIPRWLNLTTAEMRHITGFPEGMSQHEDALNIVKRTKRYIIDRYKESEATQQKIYTIEDVRNGKCAIENDGTVEELKKVIDNAFIGESMDFIIGFHLDKERYYAKANEANDWIPYSETELPTQSVKLFLSQIEGEKEDVFKEVFGDDETEEWQPKWGEEVELSFMNNWSSHKFLTYTLDKQMCILEDKFGSITNPMPLSRIRKPLSIHTFTTEQAKQYLAKFHNLNVNQIKIVE